MSKEKYSKINYNVKITVQYIFNLRVESINMLLDDIIKAGEIDEK